MTVNVIKQHLDHVLLFLVNVSLFSAFRKARSEGIKAAKGVDLHADDVLTLGSQLRGFIADLAGIHNWAANPRADGNGSNGSDERDMAQAYYERVGYTWMNKLPR